MECFIISFSIFFVARTIFVFDQNVLKYFVYMKDKTKAKYMSISMLKLHLFWTVCNVYWKIFVLVVCITNQSFTLMCISINLKCLKKKTYCIHYIYCGHKKLYVFLFTNINVKTYYTYCIFKGRNFF